MVVSPPSQLDDDDVGKCVLHPGGEGRHYHPNLRRVLTVSRRIIQTGKMKSG